MNYFFFDTETNGKILDMKAPVTDVHMYHRITQLCYAMFNEEERLYKSFSNFIKPNGWTIPTEQFFIDNNMSTERCEELGIPIEVAIDNFIKDRSSCDVSIAHNITFDARIVRAEMIRANNIKDFTSIKICTMNASTKFCALPNPNGRGGNKWPKLEELYQILFNEKFDGAHDAMNDVMATAKCFFELKRKGVIII